MYLPKLIIVLIAAASSKEREYKIQFWDDIKWEGASITRTHKDIYFCETLDLEWRNRVSSVNTRNLCYVLYDNKNCQGSKIYMYPGSYTHDNLVQLSFNDKLESFELCDLDDSITYGSKDPNALPRRSLDPNRPEKGFWLAIFTAFSTTYKDHFASRSDINHFIRWDFISGIYGTPGRQYQRALEWVQDVVAGGNFEIGVMQELRRIATEVVHDRADRNQLYARMGRTGTLTHAIHVQIELIWRQIIVVLSDEIVRAINDQGDELRR